MQNGIRWWIYNLAVQAYIEEPGAIGLLRARTGIARKMKVDGLHSNTIAEYTGLIVEEIEEL